MPPNGQHHPRGGCQRLLREQDSLEMHEPSLRQDGSCVGCMQCWAATCGASSLVSFSASTRVQLENRSALGRFYGVVDIDLGTSS